MDVQWFDSFQEIRFELLRDSNAQQLRLISAVNPGNQSQQITWMNFVRIVCVGKHQRVEA
jgi:hypothetical protein